MVQGCHFSADGREADFTNAFIALVDFFSINRSNKGIAFSGAISGNSFSCGLSILHSPALHAGGFFFPVGNLVSTILLPELFWVGSACCCVSISVLLTMRGVPSKRPHSISFAVLRVVDSTFYSEARSVCFAPRGRIKFLTLSATWLMAIAAIFTLCKITKWLLYLTIVTLLHSVIISVSWTS